MLVVDCQLDAVGRLEIVWLDRDEAGLRDGELGLVPPLVDLQVGEKLGLRHSGDRGLDTHFLAGHVVQFVLATGRRGRDQLVTGREVEYGDGQLCAFLAIFHFECSHNKQSIKYYSDANCSRYKFYAPALRSLFPAHNSPPLQFDSG